MRFQLAFLLDFVFAYSSFILVSDFDFHLHFALELSVEVMDIDADSDRRESFICGVVLPRFTFFLSLESPIEPARTDTSKLFYDFKQK
jgi:hypothetical protein